MPNPDTWVPDAGWSPLANKPQNPELPGWSTKVKTQCDHSSTDISRLLVTLHYNVMFFMNQISRIAQKTRTENNNVKQITNNQIISTKSNQ
jgi:hypothetical protein